MAMGGEHAKDAQLGAGGCLHAQDCLLGQSVQGSLPSWMGDSCSESSFQVQETLSSPLPQLSHQFFRGGVGRALILQPMDDRRLLGEGWSHTQGQEQEGRDHGVSVVVAVLVHLVVLVVVLFLRVLVIGILTVLFL